MRKIAPLLLTATVLLTAALSAHARQEPIEVLREHVAAGIAVLQANALDTAMATPTETTADRARQRDRLCAITHEMFDIYAFSRLVLAANWDQFDHTQQVEFVDLFGTYLCRYYMSELQARYNNESVSFLGQTYKSATRAVVSAQVHWRDLDIPVEVRMVLRDGRWKAYDLLIAGISGVMIYRAQFADEMKRLSPSAILDEMRQRIETQS